MEILKYEPIMLPEVTTAYNHATRDVPHCYPVGAEDFASAVAAIIDREKNHESLHSQTAFVARDGASILGFIHVGLGPEVWGEETDRGIIRFFWYDRGQRRVGQDLLNAAECYFRERDMLKVTAFPQRYRYPFYHFKYAYLSDRLDHIQALLSFNGYQRVAGEVYLDWPHYDVEPSSADVAVDISVEWPQGRGRRPGCVVRAKQAEKEVGVCQCVSGGEFSHAQDAQNWLFTTWVGVEDELQGKGLGRYLLQCTLAEMRSIGYQHAGISTAWQNYRAFLFYSNCGYRVADWTYALGRELADK